MREDALPDAAGGPVDLEAVIEGVWRRAAGPPPCRLLLALGSGRRQEGDANRHQWQEDEAPHRA